MSTKLIVTDEGRMKKKYGTAWPKIKKAIAKLVAADAKRGIATKLVGLDSAELGKSRAKFARPKTYKDAIDHVWGVHGHPDYVMILGGPDIVPHQALVNPIDDGDDDVPSDLPYACDAAGSDDVKDYVGPSRVIGRLPDIPGDKDASVLVGLLENCASWKPGKAAFKHFGVSADKWMKSTTLSLKALFGSGAKAFSSPKQGPNWSKTQLAPLIHFINCHGSRVDPQFYGEKDGEYPVAHVATNLPAKVASGTVGVAECCYGAELYEPRGVPAGICMHYLMEGALGFMGSTTIAYGPADDNSDADLICRFFAGSVMKGASLGRAMLEARLKFVEDSSPLSPTELKTVGQFMLLGDPSLHATGTEPKTGTPAFAKAITARSAIRGSLASKAVTVARGVDTVSSTPEKTADSSVQAVMEKAARAANCIPTTSTKTYEVRMAGHRASRLALTSKSFSPTRYHVMVAKEQAPPMKAVRGKRAPMGKKAMASATRKPDGVRDEVLLLAREVGGKIVDVSTLYAHHTPTAQCRKRTKVSW